MTNTEPIISASYHTGKTAPRHRTDERTDGLLYAIRDEMATELEFDPADKLRMNWVIAALAVLGGKHKDELAEILVGPRNKEAVS